MAKGRPSDPTRAERNTGHRPKPGEAKTAPGLPPLDLEVIEQIIAPPATLPPAALDLWTDAVDELVQLRTLHRSDRPLLEMMVTAAYQYRLATAEVAEKGIMGVGCFGQTIANPALKIQKDKAAEYVRIAETLGLTPVARLRLGLMRIAGQSMLTSMGDRITAEVAARLTTGGK